MTRRLLALLGLFALLLTGVPTEAQEARWSLQAIGDNGEAITNGRCRVLTAGANTSPTIYSDGALSTTATNPITMNTTSGICSWYLAAATTAVDVMVYVDSGAYKGAHVRVDNVTRTGAKTIRVTRNVPYKVLVVPFPSAASASEQTNSLSVTLPTGARLIEVVVETTTAVAGSGINVSYASSVHGTATFCNHASTGTANGFASCNVARLVGYDSDQRLLVGSAAAITLHNQNHATAGFAHVYYVAPGNE